MSNRDNKASAAEFRELVGMYCDEFTRWARVKLLLILVQFADESHSLFQPWRTRLVRALRYAWQRKAPDMAERRRQITEVVRRSKEVGGEDNAGSNTR